MTSIIKQINVTASCEKAWEMVSDTGNVPALVSLITECRLEGNTRHCTMADGSKITEKIISVDPSHKRLAYTVTDGPLPMEFHCSTMQVFKNGNGARLEWSVDIMPDELTAHLEPMMDMVVDNIKTTLS